MGITTKKPGAGDAGPHQNVDNSSNRRPKVNRQALLGQSVVVYDGQHHVGDVIERAGSGDFDAFTGTGKLIGTFPTQRAAVKAIPRAPP